MEKIQKIRRTMQSAHAPLNVVCRLCFINEGVWPWGSRPGGTKETEQACEVPLPIRRVPTSRKNEEILRPWEAAFRARTPAGCTRRTFVPRPLPNADVAIQREPARYRKPL